MVAAVKRVTHRIDKSWSDIVTANKEVVTPLRA